MKKVFCTFLICIFCTIVFGQERVNRENIHFLKEGGIITTATGWKYNEVQGKWIDNKNCISKNKVNDSLIYKLNFYDQFKSIQIKSISYEGNDYYILQVADFNQNYNNWILTKEEYKKLFTITNYHTKIEGSRFEYRSGDSEEKITYEITTHIWRYKYDFLTIYRTKENANIIRFLFSYSPSNIYTQYFEINAEEWMNLQIKDKEYYESRRKAYYDSLRNATQNSRYNYYNSNSNSNSYYNSNNHSNNKLTLDQAYAILGVKYTDDNETIKKAYHKLAVNNHPDKVENLGETERKKAEECFKKITEAYNLIKKVRNF